MARLTPGAVIVLVILFFIFVSPSTQPASIAQLVAVNEAVTQERLALKTLSTSTLDDFSPDNSRWVNLTGLREGDGFKWHLLPRVRERARIQLEQAAGGDALGLLDGTPNSSLPVYHNVSSWLKGQWVRSKAGEDLSAPNVNLSAIAPDAIYYSQVYGRNITGVEGRVHIRLNDKHKPSGDTEDGVMQSLSARITLQDDTSFADGWTSALYGVHHREAGSMLLTTTSEKFAGIFALPHFSLSSSFFELTKKYLNNTLADTINEQEGDPNDASENPWTSRTLDEEAANSPMCELIVYLQQHRVLDSSFSKKTQSADEVLVSLGILEQELRFPTGRPVFQPPKIHSSMLVFSPDCGFILESKGFPDYPQQESNHLEGPKLEVYVGRAKQIMLLFMLVITCQLLLLVDQMKVSITPSARSRISFYTITMMSLGTGFAAFGFLFLSSILVSMYLTSMTVAFLLFLEGNFFGMKFLMDVWMAQEPERTERQRRRQQRASAAVAAAATNSTSPAANRTSATEAVLPINPPSDDNTATPLPVTAPHPLETNATPLAQAVPTAPTATAATTPERPTTFGAIYTRYCLLLLSLIFISIHAATSWPLTIRSLFANTLVFLYLSFWTPQIHRNVLRNCRKPFRFRFILGQSILRLVPFAYLWVFEDNVLFVDTDRRMFVAFAAWMSLQVCILAGQEILGPRWCVSEKWSWVPVAWDYHPILKEDEESAALPIGISAHGVGDEDAGQSPSSPLLSSRRYSRSSRSSVDETGTPSRRVPSNARTFDCAICMQRREVPVVSSDGAVHDASTTNNNNHNTGITVPSGTGLGNRLLLERRRREYMVTPCRHIFDTKCLEGWMGYRLQCPTCRETLPPL